jgi:protein-tyrosine phosphatase
MDDRVKPLSGVHNFRDYGGYAARGGMLKTGLLFRSGQPCEATDADLAVIDNLALATIIDLRGDSERESWPCRRAPGFAADILFAAGETAGAGGAAHVVAARDVVTVADAHAAMIDLYAFMPRRPNLQSALRHYFSTLANQPDAGPDFGPGASMVHCFAGKDRTGLAVALFHRLMGVHHDDVMSDYLLTNSAGNSAARIEAGAAALRKRRPQASEAAIKALMSVQPAYLDAALITIDAEWGSVSTYTEAVLGVDRAARDRMTENLVIAAR